MRTILLGDEVRVERKGFAADPAGSRYAVVDYLHDPAGRSVAHAVAVATMDREPAYANALFASLEGDPEESVLLTYALHTDLDVHPDARFVVLNASRHYPSRVGLTRYWLKTKDRDPELAGRVRVFLDETGDEFAEYMQQKLPKKKGRKK